MLGTPKKTSATETEWQRYGSYKPESRHTWRETFCIHTHKHTRRKEIRASALHSV